MLCTAEFTTFQSTSSARRTTRSPCQCSTARRISIHVLREEDDRIAVFSRILSYRFQSTSSARRTTQDKVFAFLRLEISIHVLREEDDVPCVRLDHLTDISIHVLREEDDDHPLQG